MIDLNYKSLLIAEIKDLDFPSYNLDAFVMPVNKYCSYADNYFNLYDIKMAASYCHDHNKLLIVKMDKVIMEEEIEDLYAYLDILTREEIDYFIFTDMAILGYFAKKNMQSKLIYASSKMLASYEECKYYESLGIKVIPSTEISLEEIKKICTLSNICLTAYGYLDIFYSKRNLVTLFKDHQKSIFNPKKKLVNRNLYLKEQSREEENIILQNTNGTFIFSDFLYTIYSEINTVKPMMFKINSFNLEKEELIKVIDIFDSAIKNGPNIEEYGKLIDIRNNVGSGFLYRKANILDTND